MKVTIESVTSLWTDIRVEDVDGNVVFSGWLELKPDWWVLDREVKGYGEPQARWAGRRDYLSVLGDALKWIAKSLEKAP